MRHSVFLNWFDGLALLFVYLGAWRGYRRGLSEELLPLVQWGIALLLGPMKSNIDTRNAKHAEWSLVEDPDLALSLAAEWKQADDRARTFFYAGWILGGAGAALCVGGAIVLLLTPSDSTPDGYPPEGFQFAPMRVEGGGGLVLGWSW